MAVAAPERTYETDEEGREPLSRRSAPAALDAEREEREEAAPRRTSAARRPVATRSYAEEEGGGEPVARETGDLAQAERVRDRQAGLGNGYLAAADAGQAGSERPLEKPPATPVERKAAVDRAVQTREAARAANEPEYAQSVRIDRPERSDKPPVEESPEAEGEAAALGSEASADEEEAAAAAEQAGDELEQTEAETETEEEPEDAENVVGDLEQEEEEAAEEEGEKEEEGAGAAGGEGAAAVPAGVAKSQEATARLSASAAALTEAAQRPAAFSPHPEETSPTRAVAMRGAEKRRASQALADNFIARNAHHTQALLALAYTAPPRIFAAAEAAKASVDAAVAQNIGSVTAAIAGALASAQAEAAGAKAIIEAQRALTLVTVTVATITSKVEIDTLFAQTDATLTSLETTQKSGISAAYKTWQPKLEAVGTEIGGEGMAKARSMGAAWLAQRNGESSVLDGPIHDNRLEAKADAAKEVASAYQKEFEKAATEQAAQVLAGETEVQKYVTDSATQARDGLTQHRDAIVDALDQSQESSLEQANQLGDQMIQSIDSSLATTTASLMEQQVVQVARLNEYALTQKTAIDDQAGQAVAALLEGGADAVDGFSQSIREFLDTAVGMNAPEEGELSPALGEVQAQVDGLAATMIGQMEAGIAASEQGVIAGGLQAVDSVNQIGQSAVEQAQAAASGYAQSVASMLQQAIEGFTNLRDGHNETATAVRASAKEGFAEAETGLRDAFSELSKNTTDNLTAAREEMRNGMREALPKLEEDINTEAKKAADAVQPRWKSVLKWVITIVVIVAVIALTIVSAGSLGVVGTILLGAALGAAAGAATQIGHNLVDGKEWSDGVGKAMIVGAIGGAFGGIGGAIAGKVASVGLKFAIETGVDVIGGVVGDLVVGNPITAQGILFGAAIGAGVGAGVGIAGALKGKVKIRPNPPTPSATPRVGTSPAGPPAPKSRTRSLLERTTILAKTPDVPAAPRAPRTAPEPPAPPKGAGEAPAPKPSPSAKAAPEPAPKPKPAAEPPPAPKAAPEAPAAPKAKAEPDAPGAKPDAEPAAPPKKKIEGPEPGLKSKATSPDGQHEVKFTERGDVMTCSNCTTVRNKYKDVLADKPALSRRLDDIEVRAKSDDPEIVKVANDEAAALEQTLRNLKKGKPEVTLGGTRLSGKKGREALEEHLDAINRSGDPLNPAQRKKLVDLAEEFGDAVNSGKVTKDMDARLRSALEEFDPQHLGKNPALREAWERTMRDMADSPAYKKALNPDGTPKPGVSDDELKRLYKVARGKLNTHIQDVAAEIDDVFGVMKARVTGLPADVEVHHLLYKSKFPEFAVTPENLVLALRKKGGADDQLHDLLHYISSGAGRTPAGVSRWRTLLDEMSGVIRKVYGL